jgi:hypothetical protein
MIGRVGLVFGNDDAAVTTTKQEPARIAERIAAQSSPQ